jgi:hypothetical protein
VYLSYVDSTKDRWQTIKVLETNHNFCHIFPFKPLYLVSPHDIDYIHKLSQHQMDRWFSNCKQLITMKVFNSMNQVVKWTINMYSYMSNKPIPCVFLLHQMFQFLVQLKHKVLTYPKMFYPHWIIVLGHEELEKPCSEPSFDPITKVFAIQKIIDVKQFEMMKNHRLEHHVKVHFAIWRLEFAKLH